MDHDRGETLLTWTFAEYEEYVRGRRWYVLAGIVAALLLGYAFMTKNFLFAVIIIMTAVIVYLRHTRSPQQLTCELTSRGIGCAGKYWAYDDLHGFWIVSRERSSPMLYLHTNGFRPQFGVPIEEGFVDRVREILRAHVTEQERGEEPAADFIGRVLKL